MTFAGNAQSDCVCEIRKKTNPAARDTNRGWEPPLTVYPRGQGDIPQHLWDWPNGGIGAWLLLNRKEETMKKGCNKRLKYVKGPEEGKDSGAKVKRLRGSYKYIYKQTNTQKSDKVMLRKLTLTTVI